MKSHIEPQMEEVNDSREIFHYACAIVSGAVSGAYKGIEGFLNAVLHPLDEVVYPISELLHDAIIIAAAHSEGNPDLVMLKQFITNTPKIFYDAEHRMRERVDTLKNLGEVFVNAPGPKKIEMLTEAVAMILTPGFILKGAKAISNLNSIGIPYNPPKFHPYESVNPSRIPIKKLSIYDHWHLIAKASQTKSLPEQALFYKEEAKQPEESRQTYRPLLALRANTRTSTAIRIGQRKISDTAPPLAAEVPQVREHNLELDVSIPTSAMQEPLDAAQPAIAMHDFELSLSTSIIPRPAASPPPSFVPKTLPLLGFSNSSYALGSIGSSFSKKTASPLQSLSMYASSVPSTHVLSKPQSYNEAYDAACLEARKFGVESTKPYISEDAKGHVVKGAINISADGCTARITRF